MTSSLNLVSCAVSKIKRINSCTSIVSSNTAHDEVFDVGGATKSAIFDFVKGTPALECGNDADIKTPRLIQFNDLPVAYLQAG